MDTDLPSDGRALGVLDLLGLVVGELDCPPLKRHAPGEGAAYQRDGELADRTEGDGTLVGDEPQHRAVKALGLTIPERVLWRADEVIE
jgi:hypothetical protein